MSYWLFVADLHCQHGACCWLVSCSVVVWQKGMEEVSATFIR